MKKAIPLFVSNYDFGDYFSFVVFGGGWEGQLNSYWIDIPANIRSFYR